MKKKKQFSHLLWYFLLLSMENMSEKIFTDVTILSPCDFKKIWSWKESRIDIGLGGKPSQVGSTVWKYPDEHGLEAPLAGYWSHLLPFSQNWSREQGRQQEKEPMSPSRRERICSELSRTFGKKVMKDLGLSGCQIKQRRRCRLFFLSQLSWFITLVVKAS